MRKRPSTYVWILGYSGPKWNPKQSCGIGKFDVSFKDSLKDEAELLRSEEMMRGCEDSRMRGCVGARMH